MKTLFVWKAECIIQKGPLTGVTQCRSFVCTDFDAAYMAIPRAFDGYEVQAVISLVQGQVVDAILVPGLKGPEYESEKGEKV